MYTGTKQCSCCQRRISCTKFAEEPTNQVDETTEGFGGSLDLLGIHRNPSQLLQQFAAFLEADHGADGAGHAGQSGRQGGVLDPQMPVARTESAATSRAMIVGALESQRAQDTLELLGAAPGKAGLAPTTAADSLARLVAGVGAEALLDGPAGQSQGLLPDGQFQRLQIEIFYRLATEQVLNLPDDLDGQQTGDCGFF